MSERKNNSRFVIGIMVVFTVVIVSIFAYTYNVGVNAPRPDLKKAFPALTQKIYDWTYNSTDYSKTPLEDQDIKALFDRSIEKPWLLKHPELSLVNAWIFAFAGKEAAVFSMVDQKQTKLTIVSYKNPELKLPKTFNFERQGIKWRAFRTGSDNIIIKETSELMASSRSLNFIILELDNDSYIFAASRMQHVRLVDYLLESLPVKTSH